MVTEADAAGAAASDIGGTVVVKAQVKTGGRGKAGGVKLAATPEEAREKAEGILGLDIKGHIVRRVLVTAASDIESEYYVSFLLDRANRNFLAMASVEGGMDIEEVAATKPEALAKVAIDPIDGVDKAKAQEIVAAAAFPADVADQVADVLVALWQTFVAEDATLVEVNPVVKDPSGHVLALDGKVTLDDNADFRHPNHAALADAATSDPLEDKAAAKGLNYVKLSGEVGIIGNGAGLVMSTLDVVAYAGEEFGGVKPANFLDIGGVPQRRSWRTVWRSSRGSRGQGGVRERLRRHHLLRRGGRRHHPGTGDAGRPRGDPTSRSSCGWTATTPRSVARSSMTPHMT